MNTKGILALFLGMTLVVVRPADAQTAEDAIRFTDRDPATGARMIGLAGAGVAGIDDYAALFVNPAGLGYFGTSAVAGALNTFLTTDEALYDVPGSRSILDDEATATNLGNLAYIYKVPTRQGSLVFGAAFNQVKTFEQRLSFGGTNTTSTISTSFLPFDNEYDLGAEGELVELADIPFAAFQAGLIEFFPEFLEEDPGAYPFLEAVVPGSTIEQSGTVLESGRMSELSFGGAVEAARGVMVGLSGNLAFGTYNFFSRFTEEDVLDQNTALDYSVLLDDGTLLEGFDFLDVRERLETDLVGVNLRAGLTAAMTPNARFGFVVETPSYYNVNETFGRQLQTFFDDGGVLTYGDRPDDVGSGEFEYEIITPWRLSAGLAFEAATLTLMADVELVDWSQLELDAPDDPLLFDDLNLFIEENYELVFNGRAGAEYAVGGLRLRGGVAYKPDPLDVELQRSDGSTLDRDRVFFSAGLGYRVDRRFQIDFGWMQSRFENVYSAYPEDNLGPRQDDVLLIDEDVVRNQFVVGASFFF